MYGSPPHPISQYQQNNSFTNQYHQYYQYPESDFYHSIDPSMNFQGQFPQPAPLTAPMNNYHNLPFYPSSFTSPNISSSPAHSIPSHSPSRLPSFREVMTPQSYPNYNFSQIAPQNFFSSAISNNLSSTSASPTVSSSPLNYMSSPSSISSTQNNSSQQRVQRHFLVPMPPQ